MFKFNTTYIKGCILVCLILTTLNIQSQEKRKIFIFTGIIMLPAAITPTKDRLCIINNTNINCHNTITYFNPFKWAITSIGIILIIKNKKHENKSNNIASPINHTNNNRL